MMIKYNVTGIEKVIAKDNYKSGASAKVTTIISEGAQGTFPKIEDAIRFLASKFGFPSDTNQYYTPGDGVLTCSITENADGDTPSTYEVERWKDGEIDLFVADYLIYLEVAEVRDITMKELNKLGYASV